MEQALALNQEFNLDLKSVLFEAIGNDEELAMALIGASKRFNLPLNEANEYNQTPLLWACGWEKPDIAKAILKKYYDQDITINEQDEYGWTPFLWACKNGWTTIVAEMVEKKETFELDLNAKDKRVMSGFILACKEKRSEVIHVLMADDDNDIDLQAKDCYGRSGFDYLTTR